MKSAVTGRDPLLLEQQWPSYEIKIQTPCGRALEM